MKTKSAKAFVKEALTEFFNHKHCDEQTMQRYLTADFIHYVDGSAKPFDELCTHLQKQVLKFKSMHIQFLDMIAEGNKVATLHTLKVITQNGETFLWQGQAIFYLREDKIFKGIELTRAIQGSSIE